jgi:hypothetical protein
MERETENRQTERKKEKQKLKIKNIYYGRTLNIQANKLGKS